jgi:hypothetical protein
MLRAGFHMMIAVLGMASVTPASGLDLPRQDFILNCQGCHLADGSGAPGKVPNLNGFLGNFLHVPGGREFMIQVPGVAHSVLDDVRVAAVMNWVLENFSKAQIPADHKPFTAEEVGRLRANSLLDVNGRRAELLAVMKEQLGVTEDSAP